jgi:hypothetical protein
MVDHSNEARRILMDLDIGAMRRMHKQLSPHLPDPGTDQDVLAAMHGARTQLDNIPLRYRQYSHRWLTERDLPSHLPPPLWEKEPFVPRVVEGVGIMVAASSEELEPAALLVRREMENVVLDAYADSSSPDAKKLQERMMLARKKELNSLLLPDKSARPKV